MKCAPFTSSLGIAIVFLLAGGILAENDTAQLRSFGPEMHGFRKPERDVTMVVDGFLWLDAEDFSAYGGWRIDTQFVHKMGSAYLLAAGVGRPVADAVTTVDVPRAGTYRIWVRGKNWYPAASPGQFQLVVQGRPTEVVFGKAATDQWVWESAGEFDLPSGPAELALRDLTGYFARCDALILTTDLEYRPPVELGALETERSRLTGIPREPHEEAEFEVVVVGAGAAGCSAAIAAARTGARTALIQNRPVLGGNASVELGVWICGAGSRHAHARESGIIEEAGRIRTRHDHPKMSEPFRLLVEAERDLIVFVNRHVFDVEMASDDRIAAVKAIDTLTGKIHIFRGSQFIDCTGDGWVGFFAGAEFRMGRESREEFGEDLAPSRADGMTMSGCLMGNLALSYRALDMGRPIEYEAPGWAASLPVEEFGRSPRGFTSGQWWLEHEGDIDDLDDPERARDELIRISFGYWDFIKNHWADRDRAAHYGLAYVPHGDAKRETRRLMGDYVLTQIDAQQGEMFPDRISYGGWPLDVHHPDGIYSGPEGPYDCNGHVPIYSIPFRCLYSVNIENLLFAGRNVSVTHVALGSVRVQGTLATLGQATGTAAAMCVREQVSPRELGRSRIWQLQQTLLKHDQYIPGIRNEDPDDLARRAGITASSTATRDVFDVDKICPDILHPLNMARAVMFPRGIHDTLDSVQLLLSSQRSGPVELELHLRPAEAPGDFSAKEDIGMASATLPPQRETLVTFPVHTRIEAPYVWAWLPKTEGVSWRLMSSAPDRACRAYGGSEQRPWTVVEGQYYAFCTAPPLTLARDYRPANVTNGTARSVDGVANLWASDPCEPFPQRIDLAFPEPVDVNTVYLTFDTDLDAAHHSVPLVSQTVRSYTLSCHDGERWLDVAVETDNFQRRRVHRFEPMRVGKLRLTVQATNGDRSARVFEIRAYHESRAD